MAANVGIRPEGGTGRTSRLMLDAPRGAHFIWCTDNAEHAKELARRVGRTDLVCHPRYALRELAGVQSIVVDHAAWLSDEDREWLQMHARGHGQ
jgi:hypothetical protein